MFPLRHPLRTPQLVDQPTAKPDTAQLELTDEYIAELLLREAREAAKKAEKYGVMSYLSGTRAAPQRKEKPDAQFFNNVMRNTIGSSEYQERKRQLQKIQQDEVDYYRRKHRELSGSQAKANESNERHEKRRKKDKQEKKEKKSKKEKKEKKDSSSHSHSAKSVPHSSSTAAPALPKVRGRGARAFNPRDPDAAHGGDVYESLPVQVDDQPRAVRSAPYLHSPSPRHSRSRSRSPSPYGPRPYRR